ncbi:MAG: serine/threonine-protein kinase, partial [Polyangia bacterium]
MLGGRFVVEEIIGQGGMGSVWAGVDKSSGARVAIKVIQATSSRQLDALRRFIREAGATATVNHPAVVRMLHVDVSDDGLLFQVQELVVGETLTRRLGLPWPPGEAARLGAVLAEALAAAHAEGVVHRDVKPDNVMLTTTAPGLKLLDFGIAKLYDAVSLGRETTHAGVILGTPAYMAPEQ